MSVEPIQYDYYINNWLLDIQSGVIIHQHTGEKKRLGEYQVKLLDVLIQHAGQTLSRDELTNLVWEKRVIGNNSLPNAIHALRMALEDDGKQQRIIKTIPKKGYILDEEYCEWVQRIPTPPATSSINQAENSATLSWDGELAQKKSHSYAVVNTDQLNGVKRSSSYIKHSFLILLLILLALSGWGMFLWNYLHT